MYVCMSDVDFTNKMAFEFDLFVNPFSFNCNKVFS